MVNIKIPKQIIKSNYRLQASNFLLDFGQHEMDRVYIIDVQMKLRFEQKAAPFCFKDYGSLLITKLQRQWSGPHFIIKINTWRHLFIITATLMECSLWTSWGRNCYETLLIIITDVYVIQKTPCLQQQSKGQWWMWHQRIANMNVLTANINEERWSRCYKFAFGAYGKYSSTHCILVV